MLCELKGESQGTGVPKTERNLPDKKGREEGRKRRREGGKKGGFCGEVLASESLGPGKRSKDS